MPHSGSAFNTSSKTLCDARYQNECWYSIALSNSFCACGLHEVSKCTLPSLLSSTCPKAGCASTVTVDTSAAAPHNVLIMIYLLALLLIQLSYMESVADHLTKTMWRNVRFWPLADIPSCTAHVRFRG